MCLSVCLSVTSRYCIETATRIELDFGTQVLLDLSYIVLKDVRVSPKIRILLSGTLSETLALENFAVALPPSPSAIHKRQSSVCRDLATVDEARCCQQSTDDRHLLTTLSVQLCVHRDGRLHVTRRCADPSALAETCL